MIHTKIDRRNTQRSHGKEERAARVRALVEAGASGRVLTGMEVREVCEALRSQIERTPTHFHSGFGA